MRPCCTQRDVGYKHRNVTEILQIASARVLTSNKYYLFLIVCGGRLLTLPASVLMRLPAPQIAHRQFCCVTD